MNPIIRDHLNLYSHLTPSKMWNQWVLFLSYYLSKFLKRPIQWGYPSSISFEPTTSCNLRCPECPSGLRAFSRPTGMLQEELFEDVMKQMKSHLNYLTFYFQGEPYLNPKFLDMVAVAKKYNIYTATSSNAHYLKDEVARKTVESGLDRLIISIDGTSQDTYQSYRIGGKLEKVIEGTKNVLKWKKDLKSATPHVIFQFLVVKPNEHQIPEVMKLGKELGVDEVRLKTAQVYDYENGNDLIPDDGRYARYKENKDGTWSIKNKMVNSCWRMWQGCVITWDGAVVPCCFDKDATHQLGKLENTSFKSIWNGADYQNFRQSLLRSRSEIDICKNCTEGTKIWG